VDDDGDDDGDGDDGDGDGDDGACAGVFINEGAYYYAASGVGVGVVRKGFAAVPARQGHL
jgi:hypothetical protein